MTVGCVERAVGRSNVTIMRENKHSGAGGLTFAVAGDEMGLAGRTS